MTFLLGMLTPAGRCCNYNNEHEIFFSIHSHSKVATVWKPVISKQLNKIKLLKKMF